MDLRERLLQVAESIAEQPRRYLVSTTGVFWGAAAIVIMLAWAAGLREYMREELSRYGRGGVQVLTGVSSSGFPGFREGVPIRFRRDDLVAAENAHDVVEAILPELRPSEGRSPLLEASGRVRRFDVFGVDPRWGRYRNFKLSAGRFLQEADVQQQRPIAVLGFEAALELFGGPLQAHGRILRIDGRPFQVIGVAADKGRQYIDPGLPDDRLVLVPITTAEKRLGFGRDIEHFTVIPRPEIDGPTALEAALRTLGPRGGFHPGDVDAIRRNDTSRLGRMADLVIAGLLWFIAFAGTITLLVGAVGIANAQLATLSERTLEIGVCKAMGARNRTLVGQTVLESLCISLGSALLGVMFGISACVALATLAPRDMFPAPIISGLVAAITLIALSGVSVVAALLPAIRVRGMEIAGALRASA